MSNPFSPLAPLWQACRGKQFRPTVTLLSSTLLVIAWKCFGTPEFFADWLMPRLGMRGAPYPWAGFYCYLSAFFLLGVVPVLIVKFVFRESLADYGVRWGVRSGTLLAIVLGAPCFILGGWLASLDPTVHAYYPISKINMAAAPSPGLFAWHAVAYLSFYLGWEFHFRGFLQQGVRESLGDANTVLIQSLASCLAHLGRPTGEVFAALPAGLFWGIMALRTQSLLGGLVQHFLLGIMLDWFICYG